jgi:hypothetical protein
VPRLTCEVRPVSNDPGVEPAVEGYHGKYFRSEIFDCTRASYEKFSESPRATGEI